jgi:NAD(P) transhydrogenase
MHNYKVGIARFREVSRGHIIGLENDMMKLIFSQAWERASDAGRACLFVNR